MKRLQSLLFLTLLTSISFLFTQTDALAQDIDSNHWYRLTTSWQGDGKSLDVVNDGKNNRLQLAKTGNVSGQFWKITPLGKGFYRLTTQWQGDGKSLDVINDGKNNRLQLAKTGGYSGQFWKLKYMGNGFYRMTTSWQGDGKSLDVINDGKNNRIHLAKTGNYSGQFWKLTKIQPIQNTPTPSKPATPKFATFDKSANYVIQPAYNDKAFDIPGGSKQNGAKLLQWAKHNGPNQQFRLEPKDGGYYVIVNVNSGKAIDVPGGSMQDGVQFVQWDKHGGPNQQFGFEQVGADTYIIVNRKSGKVMDVYGGSRDNGGKITQFPKHGRENQRFRLVKVKAKPAPNNPSTAKVNGRDVKFLEFGQNGRKLGVYQQVGAKSWKEIAKSSFNFEERNRDDWSVYLYDKSRNVHIQLDLHTKKIYYRAGNAPKSPIYDIMTTSREMQKAPSGGNNNNNNGGNNNNNNGGTQTNNGGNNNNNNGGTHTNNGGNNNTNKGPKVVNTGNIPTQPKHPQSTKVVVKPKQKVSQPIPESQMTQMLNSTLASLLGSFKVHKLTSTVEGGQAIFRGTAAIANVNTVQIEATLQPVGNSVGINSFAAILPNNAQMATQIIERLIGTSLNKQIPAGFPTPTVRSFTLYFAEDGRNPEALEAIMGSSQSWDVLKSGTFSVEDITLSLGASGLNTGSKSIKTALKGSSNLQGVTMAVEGNLTGNRADGADVVLKGSVGNIKIGQLIKGVAGANAEVGQVIALIPDRFLNISIQNLTAAISPTQKSFATNMKASFGDFEVMMQRNNSGKMAFTLGIQPPNVTKLIDLVGSPALNGLKQLSDLDFALIVSSANGGIESSLPAFTNQGLNAVRGLNIITQYALNQKFASLLGVQTLTVTGQIPKNPINLMLTANVESNAKIGSAFTFKGIKFELKPNPNDLFMGAGGDFVIHLKDTDLNFGGKMRMFPVEAKLQGELTLKAVGNNGTDVWQNPFGIPGVGIAELGIAPSITANFPWVGGAAKGVIELGTTSKKIRGGVTLAIDVANPHKSLLDASINELSVAGFIDAFSTRGTPSSMRTALGSGLKNALVYIAPSPMNLMGKNYSRGINIQGQTNLYGLKSDLRLKIDPESFVIDIKGEVDNIALRSGGFTFFELSGENRPKALMKVLASTTQYPELEINGAVTVLEMKRATLIKINKDLMKFKQTGSLFGGGFTAVVDVEAKNFTNFNNANYYAKVKMTNEVQTKLSNAIVSFIKDRSKDTRKALDDTKKYVRKAKTGNDFTDWFLGAANTALDGVKHAEKGLAVAGEYVTIGVLEEAFNLKEIGFEAGLNSIRAKVAANTKLTIVGATVNEKTDIQLDMKNIDSQINKMAAQIGKKIIKQLGSVATPIGNEVNGLVNDAGKEFSKVGNWLSNKAAAAAAEAKKAAEAAKREAEKAAKAAGKGLQTAGKETVKFAKKLKFW